METMGERIRAEREDQGLSRATVAKRAKIAPSTLSDLELGYSTQSVALHRIADALGVSARWLETGTGGKRSTAREGDNSGMAEVHIGIALTVQAMVATTPDAGQRLVSRLESLPNGLPDRPFLKALIDTIRAELAQQALLPAPTPQEPTQDAHKRR